MSLAKLRNSLPALNGESLDFIFDHVYEISGILGEDEKEKDCKLGSLLGILKALQRFNYDHRLDGAFELHQKAVAPAGLELQSNSDGSVLWLAMLLAIKELYGLSNSSLIRTIRQISIRN